MQEDRRVDLAVLLRSTEEWNARRRAAGDDARLPDLTGTVLAKANLRGARLEKIRLGRADLSGADLAGANLWQADAVGADFSRADLSDADLCRTRLARADLTEAILAKVDALAACFAGAKLCGANAAAANLKEADLRDADLRGADLRLANLFEANLTGADLTGANLTGANLNGAVLEGAKMDRAVLRDVHLSMTAIPSGYPSYGSRPTWSSYGPALFQVLKTAASVEGAQFDEEFTRRRLPSLKRAIADANQANRQGGTADGGASRKHWVKRLDDQQYCERDGR